MLRHVNPSAKHLAHGKHAKIVNYYQPFFCSGIVLHLAMHQSPMEFGKESTFSGSTPNPLIKISGIGAWACVEENHRDSEV